MLLYDDALLLFGLISVYISSHCLTYRYGTLVIYLRMDQVKLAPPTILLLLEKRDNFIGRIKHTFCWISIGKRGAIKSIILIRFEMSSTLSYLFSVTNLICHCYTLNNTLCRRQDAKDKTKYILFVAFIFNI